MVLYKMIHRCYAACVLSRRFKDDDSREYCILQDRVFWDDAGLGVWRQEECQG